MSTAQVVRRELEQSAELKRAIDDALCERVALVAERILRAVRSGGKVILFGNGGSAADAQHLAAELVGRFRRERAAIPALALTANSSTVTSIANDYSYADVFARQVEAFARPGDVAIGITTSGNSTNVVKALEIARASGALTVAMTGAGGGECARVAELLIAVPSNITARIQEVHITLGHILCGLVEQGTIEVA